MILKTLALVVLSGSIVSPSYAQTAGEVVSDTLSSSSSLLGLYTTGPILSVGTTAVIIGTTFASHDAATDHVEAYVVNYEEGRNGLIAQALATGLDQDVIVDLGAFLQLKNRQDLKIVVKNVRTLAKNNGINLLQADSRTVSSLIVTSVTTAL